MSKTLQKKIPQENQTEHRQFTELELRTKENLDAVKHRLRNALEDCKELIMQDGGKLASDVDTLTTMNVNLELELVRLRELCRANKIDPNPPKPKEPNRAQKRAAAKKSKKAANKAK